MEYKIPISGRAESKPIIECASKKEKQFPDEHIFMLPSLLKKQLPFMIDTIT